MREIMFRCIDKTNPDLGPFHGGFAVHATGKIVENIEAFNGKTENLIVMQYTGLKDKKGKDIYEGDILEAPSENNFEVFWSENTTGYLIRDSANTFYINSGLYEIVGNIYQNPELLN